jgi:hypothetical protein
MIKPRSILLLTLFIIFSRWLYPVVQGNWATIYIPLPSNIPRTAFASGAWLSAGAAIGSLICALVLAWPLGYLTKEKPFILGAGLGLVGTGLHIYDFPALFIQFNWFSGTISIIEHLSFLLGCVLFAKWGSALRDRKDGQHALRP